MRGLSNEQRAELAAAVDRLAWTSARETAGPDADRRESWLAALTSLLVIRDSAEQLAASAALSAAQHGADYPDIGAAAGMTRQGARRKWPGLAGLADARQRKLAWWNTWGEQFVECVRAVLAVTEELPWSANLRARLEEASSDALDLMVVDAHAVALNAATPADPAAARSIGLLAALTADAYAATNGHSALIGREAKACGTVDCPAEPIVDLLRPDDHGPVPACRQHAVEALRRPATRIVSAYQPDVALSVLTEAHG
ncbi:hypothetical protein [Kutzneria kofuensis]|uniref:Uncharacterized protein n=1 Tax=Kutzneria kofuensis TaxID=103725 RepID=A0A7W9NM27_9PSEU|nr:hypothetical protein [Kutzneria kofuensis]MBB5896903.1 hypothetical protein [Kutzneria kofuensis]